MNPEDRLKNLGSGTSGPPSEDDWAAFQTRAHRSLALRRLAAVAGSAALLLAVVGGAWAVTRDPVDKAPRPEIAGSPTDAAPSEEPSEEPDPNSIEVEEETPGDEMTYLQQWYIESDDTLLVTHWPFEPTQTPARDALENLISFIPGPLGETGARTAIPEGTQLAELTIEDGTADVTLTGSSPESSHAYAQIVYTLTQFPTVKDVQVAWESEDTGGISTGLVDRKTYEDLLPPIVVESPFDGQAVDWTFDLYGIANVYEATVSWRLLEQNGDVIKEGFTTATCGTGCWGTFEERISIERFDGRQALLQVFQASAEDGSPMNMVEIPLNFTSGS